MEISRVKPYEKNAKKHPKKQVEQVAASIKEFGFNQPIVIDKKGVIIVGHGRLEAAKLLGMTDVPVIEVDLTEEQAKAYRLADNKLNESEWDMKLAVDELKELSEEMQGLTGFDLDLLIEPDEKDDEIPENVPARSKLGDLYELGTHRVLCGDSTKIDDVERLMDGKKADMVFTDPPYGMNLNTDYARTNRVEGKTYRPVMGDDEDFDPTFFFDYFDYCPEQFWWGADYYCQFIPKGGAWEVWDKKKDDLDESIGTGFELCWSRQPHKRMMARFLWSGFTAKERNETRVHPTQKPIGLCEWFFTRWGKDGETIADLFLGSGSTLIAAEKTGRVCYGMELSEAYIDVIVSRYCEYTNNYDIIKNGEKIRW